MQKRSTPRRAVSRKPKTPKAGARGRSRAQAVRPIHVLLALAIVGLGIATALLLNGTAPATSTAGGSGPHAGGAVGGAAPSSTGAGSAVSPSAVSGEEPGNPGIALPSSEYSGGVDAAGLAGAEAALRAAGPTAGSASTAGASAASKPAAAAPVGTTPAQPASLRLQPSAGRRPDGGIKPARGAKTLIIVIDDAGNNYTQLEPFLKLPFPLTVAVLPDLPYSKRDASAVTSAGKELILHQPMQPIGGQNPGPGALTLGMGAGDVQRIIEQNLQTVPGAVGMNNHMGSAATSDLDLMEKVATVAKERGIYYLDSLTISSTAVPEAARREGIRYWERSVFLDNSTDRASIVRAVDEGKRRAMKTGSAIMIGHVWSAELAQTLMELYPQLVEEGFSLSTISRFMLSEAAEDDASTGH